MGTFRVEVLAINWARTLLFREFRTCGAPEFFREKDPISSRRWLVGMAKAFWMSFCPEGSKVRFASCLLKDRARDLWKEVDFALRGEALETMT